MASDMPMNWSPSPSKTDVFFERDAMKVDLKNPTLAHSDSRGFPESDAVSRVNILRGYIHPIEHSAPTTC